MRRSKSTKISSKAHPARPIEPNGGSLAEGRRVLEIEARAVQALIERLDDQFAKAVDLLYAARARSSSPAWENPVWSDRRSRRQWPVPGTPAFFLHPAEGIHGDLGMLGRADVLIAISNSGETQEILQLLPYVERMGIPVVSMTGRMTSTLGQEQ